MMIIDLLNFWSSDCQLIEQQLLNNLVLVTFAATVVEESWCWENETVEFQVSESDVNDLKFVQSGYILKCILSHNITLVS